MGLFSSFLGARSYLVVLPESSLQVAEYLALCMGMKEATRAGCSTVTIVGDNLASLCCFRKLTPYTGNRPLGRVLRHLFNWWWRVDLVVHVLWVPAALNPADPLSRLRTDGSDARRMYHRVLEKFEVLTQDFSVLHLVGSVFV